jgi:hypothetical protein
MASPIVKVLTEGIGELNLRDIEVYKKTGGYVLQNSARRP